MQLRRTVWLSECIYSSWRTMWIYGFIGIIWGRLIEEASLHYVQVKIFQLCRTTRVTLEGEITDSIFFFFLNEQQSSHQEQVDFVVSCNLFSCSYS